MSAATQETRPMQQDSSSAAAWDVPRGVTVLCKPPMFYMTMVELRSCEKGFWGLRCNELCDVARGGLLGKKKQELVELLDTVI
jgi:hypothetical protein